MAHSPQDRRHETTIGAPQKVYVAGDSTASTYHSDRAPRTGWGQVLASRVSAEVDNRAISGASSRSFIDRGALGDLLADLNDGDILLIAFGHNDPKAGERFADVDVAFPAQLRRFVSGARIRSAIPVLVTPTERSADDTHFSERGAAAVADLVCASLAALGLIGRGR